MYEAFNNQLVCTHEEINTKTASGIELGSTNKACEAFRVVATTDLTKALQDKVIYCEGKYKNYHLPEKGAEGETYYTIPADAVLAIRK